MIVVRGRNVWLIGSSRKKRERLRSCNVQNMNSE